MTSKITLSPPPSEVEEFDYIWKAWFTRMYERVGDGPLMIRGYTVATVPDADQWSDNSNFSAFIFISDEVGGSIMAFSDGTNWRRCTDRAIIA